VAIYLDHNAAAPLRPTALEAMLAAAQAGGNPSSVHAAGRRAKAVLEQAREQVARAVGARAENLVFTSGATEALHLAMQAPLGAAGRLILADIEHVAVDGFASLAFSEVAGLGVRADGVIDLAQLEALLAESAEPALVALQLANNETGAVQPISEAARLVRAAGGLLLVDAAQALGRMPVDLGALGAHYLVVSSHKIGGPAGAGALALAPGAPYIADRRGGGQERGRRPGTENVPAIAGFGAAAAASLAALAEEPARLAGLRDGFEAGLRARFADAVVFAAQAPRLPNTTLFALPGLAAETAVIALDLEGVAVSSGAACSSGKVGESRVLAAMGVEPALARCALRISFGWDSQEEHVGAALDALARVLARSTQWKGAA